MWFTRDVFNILTVDDSRMPKVAAAVSASQSHQFIWYKREKWLINDDVIVPWHWIVEVLC